jgi:hypothetical protein
VAKSHHDAKASKGSPNALKEKSHNPVPPSTKHLFRGRRVLGDGLGTLRHGVLSKLTGQDQADRGLDLSGRDGGLLVVCSELASLGCDALEDVCRLKVSKGHCQS